MGKGSHSWGIPENPTEATWEIFHKKIGKSVERVNHARVLSSTQVEVGQLFQEE